jgi:hypothetical protein
VRSLGIAFGAERRKPITITIPKTCRRALAMVTLGMVSINAWARQPHYVFTLPSGYVGWVQVVFGDTGTPTLSAYKKKDLLIAIDDSGVFRTRTLPAWFFTRDEFFYREPDPHRRGTEKLVPVRSDYVVDVVYDGGFCVSGTPDGSPGSASWFFFVGPPEVRATIPLADSRREPRKTPLPPPSVYPAPGRMQ